MMVFGHPSMVASRDHPGPGSRRRRNWRLHRNLARSGRWPSVAERIVFFGRLGDADVLEEEAGRAQGYQVTAGFRDGEGGHSESGISQHRRANARGRSQCGAIGDAFRYLQKRCHLYRCSAGNAPAGGHCGNLVAGAPPPRRRPRLLMRAKMWDSYPCPPIIC
jgi:hypothetical protein